MGYHMTHARAVVLFPISILLPMALAWVALRAEERLEYRLAICAVQFVLSFTGAYKAVLTLLRPESPE